MFRGVLRLPVVLSAALFAAACAQAGPLVLSIVSPNRTGSPGDNFQFTGTITNNSGVTQDPYTLSLDVSGFDVAALDFPVFLFDDSFTLAPGDTSPVVDLFSIRLLLTAAPGTYTADASIQDFDFVSLSDPAQVTITAAPEPSTAWLLLPAMAGLILNLRRRRTGRGN